MDSTAVIFVEKAVVIALHDRQLGEHGGAAGVRDEGLLDSALDRPRNKHAYGVDDLHELAASFAFGIAKNHPFLDANKRTALHVALLFLKLNGAGLPDPSMELVEKMVQLAEGSLSEAGFADWLRVQAGAR